MSRMLMHPPQSKTKFTRSKTAHFKHNDIQSTFSQHITSIFVFQKEFPGPQPTVDSGILLTVNVQVVITLPEMPPLLHLSNGVAFSILHKDGAVDEVEGPADPENDLPTCEKCTKGI